jgi:hypothetical protein
MALESARLVKQILVQAGLFSYTVFVYSLVEV